MVTGDYHYTATSVARRVGMVPADAKVMIIQAESEFRSLHSDSFPSESQREAHAPVHSPPGWQSGTGGERAKGGPPPSPYPSNLHRIWVPRTLHLSVPQKNYMLRMCALNRAHHHCAKPYQSLSCLPQQDPSSRQQVTPY